MKINAKRKCKEPWVCFFKVTSDQLLTARNSSLAQGSRFGYPGKSEMEQGTHEKEAKKQETPTKAFSESVGL